MAFWTNGDGTKAATESYLVNKEYYARQEIDLMKFQTTAIATLLLTLVVLLPSQTFASGDRVQFFQNIRVGQDERVDSAVCMFCSIHVRGTSGDTVAILGDIVVDGTVTGDCVSVGGGIKLNDEASVAGDAVAIGRGLYRDPNATVKGDAVSQSGPLVYFGLFLGLFVIPLLPIILIIALIVWLFRRNRYPQQAPVGYRR
ncbi:MAG TPA: hypothetical protein VF783_08820 [Terriglobales bacterium]